MDHGQHRATGISYSGCAGCRAERPRYRDYFQKLSQTIAQERARLMQLKPLSPMSLYSPAYLLHYDKRKDKPNWVRPTQYRIPRRIGGDGFTEFSEISSSLNEDFQAGLRNVEDLVVYIWNGTTYATS